MTYDKMLIGVKKWFLIEKNKLENSYNNKSLKLNIYGPAIGTFESKSDENSWVYVDGKWKKQWKQKGWFKNHKYKPTAIELLLTN